MFSPFSGLTLLLYGGMNIEEDQKVKPQDPANYLYSDKLPLEIFDNISFSLLQNIWKEVDMG